MILNIFGFVRTWFKNSKVQKIESGTFGTYGEKGMCVCVWHLCHDGLFGNPIMPSQVKYFAHFLCEQSSPVPKE